MKALYYDCFAGLSGDMNLGAMLDLGVELEYLKEELSKLGLDHEFMLEIKTDDKHGIFGKKVDVIDLNNSHDHDDAHNHDHDHDDSHDQGHPHDHKHHDHHDAHDHGDSHDHGNPHDHDDSHDHEHHNHHDHHDAHDHSKLRDFKQIRQIIEASTLSQNVKTLSLKVFLLIATAEAKIHGRSVDEVHFHEVGAIDSIVDVVGAAICLDALGVEKIMASTVEVGNGFVRCAHGLMPIPAPATAEILTGVPISSKVDKFEMTTPTGAAILKAFVDEFTNQKNFTIEKVGYGLGSRNLDIPNLVRVMLVTIEEATDKATTDKATTDKATTDKATTDKATDIIFETNLGESTTLPSQWILESNIDDMSSEQLVYAEERLFVAGALDVYKTPIIMKKGRAAIKLTILAQEKDIKQIQKTMFTETTSIGMRMYPVEKVKIERSFEIIDTEFGPISLKKAFFQGELVNVKPEYEQIKSYALSSGLSIKEVYRRINKLL